MSLEIQKNNLDSLYNNLDNNLENDNTNPNPNPNIDADEVPLSSSPKYGIQYKPGNGFIQQIKEKPEISLDAEELDKKYFDYDFNLEIKTSSNLSAKQYLLIIPITNFFKKTRNLYILYNILKCKSVISLRLVEYFVVNYVLDNNTHFDLSRYKSNPSYIIDNLFTIQKQWSDYDNNYDDDKSTFSDLFMIHDNYKCKLKEYNKKNFDPFCRWQRIIIIYDKKSILKDGELITIREKSFETTVAQLNFFKWIIENHIIDYIVEHFEEINVAMNKFELEIKRHKYRKSKKSSTSSNSSDENTNTDTTDTTDTIDTIDTIDTTDTTDTTDNTNSRNLERNEPNQTQTTSRSRTTSTSLNIENVSSINELLLNRELNTTFNSSTDTKQPSTVNMTQQELQNIKKTKKKEIVYCNADRKTTKKQRIKKEFTKTNRNIMRYNKPITLKFD
jgi:hypothetical protein